MKDLGEEALDLKSICNRYWLLIVCVAGTVICAYLVVDSGWSLLWPQTEATIADYTFSQRPYYRPGLDIKSYLSGKSRKFPVATLVYTYQASNQTFRSGQIRPDAFGNPVSYAERHPLGSKIKLRVNPFDPSKSTLVPGRNLFDSMLLFVVCVLLTFYYAAADLPRRK
jgi:hypothetical protein